MTADTARPVQRVLVVYPCGLQTGGHDAVGHLVAARKRAVFVIVSSPTIVGVLGSERP